MILVLAMACSARAGASCREVRVMECGCSCDVDYDSPQIYEEVSRMARKAWVCYECGDPIAIGERYLDVSWLCDGSWGGARVCRTCERMHLDWCCAWGELASTIWDAVGVNPYTGEEASDE